jgi:hypothetical protein
MSSLDEFRRLLPSFFSQLKDMNVRDLTEISNKLAIPDRLTGRKKRLLSHVKIVFAHRVLTLLLGCPPRIEDVVEVSGATYDMVRRALNAIKEQFPSYDVIKKRHSEVADLLRTSNKGFVWKKRGKREHADSGRPNTFFVVVEAPLIDKLQLTFDEREKLCTYLLTPPFGDAMKKLIIEYFHQRLDLFGTPNYMEMLKITHQFLSPIWRKAFDIARKRGSQWLTPEVEKRLSLDWLLSAPQLPFDELKQRMEIFLKEIEVMSNEDFAKRFIIPIMMEKRSLAKTVKLRFISENEALLKCVMCGCDTPLHIPLPEPIKCKFCGAEYEEVN